MARSMSSRRKAIGLCLVSIGVMACSGEPQGEAVPMQVDRSDVRPAASAAKPDAQEPELKNPLHSEREAPTGELDDAGAKLVFNLRGCNACHGVNEQRIGPSYLAVAQRYAAEHAENPLAREQALAAKIRFGGAGAWGMVPMVSNPNVSQDEAMSIARWIMQLGSAPASDEAS